MIIGCDAIMDYFSSHASLSSHVKLVDELKEKLYFRWGD